MSDGIQGGRGPLPPDLRNPSLGEEKTPPPKKATRSQVQNAPLDQFERAHSLGSTPPQGAVLPPQAHVQTSAQTERPAFSSEAMAALASAFAAVMSQHPTASRAERAKHFSRAVLKRSKLKKLFGKMSEAQLEAMCDAIGDALGDSPVFGKLIDDISEEAGRQGG